MTEAFTGRNMNSFCAKVTDACASNVTVMAVEDKFFAYRNTTSDESQMVTPPEVSTRDEFAKGASIDMFFSTTEPNRSVPEVLLVIDSRTLRFISV